MFLAQPIAVEARPNYRLWVKYADGPSGEVDLSDLVGKSVYAAWNDPDFFQRVHIDPETQMIAWGNNVDICPDGVYLAVTGLSYKEVYPDLTEPPAIGWHLAAEKNALNRLKAVEVKPGAGHRIRLRYSDGASGEVDLSPLAGSGVFKAWLDRAFFDDVCIGESGEISWRDELALDPFQLYTEITGAPVAELFPDLGQAKITDA